METPAPAPTTESAPDPRLRASAILPWLLLLPPGVLALPGFLSPVAGDPYPELTGMALVTCLALPAALWIAIAGTPRIRGLWILLLFFAVAAGQMLFLEQTDALNAGLRTASIATAIVLLIGGASLDPPGRRTFNRGLVVLSSVWTGAAWIAAGWSGEEHLAGVLGNTGLLSQAALPGAAIGAWYVATRSGPYRLLGALAFGLFLAHAGLSPVIAGSGSLLGVLVFSAIRSPWSRGRAKVRKRLGLMAATVAFCMAVLLSGGGSSGDLDDEGQEAAPTASTASQDLGGIDVRLGIWSQLPSVLADAGFFGLGPGQFHAQFPPYRSVEEMELSRGGVCERADTEVDHPHNDGLLGFFELGIPGGTLLVLFLLLALQRALSALQETDFASIALGAGGLSLLLLGCAHGPLFVNPAASSIGWVILGALLVLRPEEIPGANPTPSRWSSIPVALVALLGALHVWPRIPHGWLLRAHGSALESGDTDAAAAALRGALARVPDSAPALRLAAQGDLGVGPGGSGAVANWERLLAIRPWSVEALNNGGLAHLAAGRPAQAKDLWQRALGVAPTHPRLIENLGRLQCLEGNAVEAEAWSMRLAAHACSSRTWLIRLGIDALRRGRWSVAAPLIDGAPLETLSPESLFARAAEEPFASIAEGTRSARALAHVLWARQQVEAQDLPTAVRSFRQALAATRGGANGSSAAATATLELAAILSLAERDGECREQLELAARSSTRVHRNELPDWAVEQLARLGVDLADDTRNHVPLDPGEM